MKNYKKSGLRNHYLETQAKQKIPEISVITDKDKEIYDFFFKNKIIYRACYSYGWAYIIQAARNIGQHLGLKFSTEDCLITIGIHNSHFVIIRPLGNYIRYLPSLLAKLREISKKPVYIKKMTEDEIKDLEKFVSVSKASEEYPWSEEWKEDDDTCPEVIIDVNRVLRYYKTPCRELKKIRWRVHKFIKRGHNITLAPYSKELYLEVHKYLEMHFGGADSVFAEAYENLLIHLPNGTNGKKFFSFVAYNNDRIVGYFFAERVDEESAALYASIGSREKELGGLTEFLYIEMMKRLKEAGIKYLNFGGSEVKGLDHFKMQFFPIETKKLDIFVYGL